MRRTGEPLTDWEQLRQRFCEHSCSITKERMKAMIAENVWRGDHHAYSARFAAIVAQGVPVAPDLLVGYYLANLPDEIAERLTEAGTRKFSDWQEASAALAAKMAPWEDFCEDRHRFQRDLEDAKRRWAYGGREPGLLRERENSNNRRNDTTDLRCYACSGRGHASRDCPLRPNSIPVSPDWGKRLRIGEERERPEGPDVGETQLPLADQSHAETTLQIKEGSRRRLDHSGEQNDATTEGDRPQDTSTKELQWWREQRVQEDATPKGTLCSVGMTAVLRVEVAGNQCEALLDTGASRSFISPGAVERLQLRTRKLPEEHVFTVANGAQLRIVRVVKGLTMWCGTARLAGDFLVGPVPYDLVRTPAEQAYDILAKQVADMTREEATALLSPPSKRYKPPPRGKRKAVVAALLQQTSESAACIHHPLQGLNVILALPAMESDVALRLMEEWQGALCCVLVEASPSNPHRQCLKALPVSAFPDDEETSPWPTAKLEYSKFDTWLTSEEAQETPRVILDVLCTHRAVFPDKLPTGLPPKRPHDHRILLVPGKLPTKSAIYRMTPEQLLFHKQEIAKLSANGWIGPTYSPICAPTIMVDKRSDGTGERFHQIRMAKEDRWKTAFRSVMGLFEYKVMPFGLKGAPATFQANINAYLQPLLGQGVIAYLDDVLIYSPDLPSHVTLLQQVLRIFLDQQFYPKFSKCKFAKRELTYLGYTVSAEGIKPAPDKIQVIKAWPEVLENETQIRQFLGTVNYCRMFMGPDFARVARPLVDLTRKGVPFQWTDAHTQAVRHLKQRLIDYTTLQISDTTKPFELYC
ncbi:OSJNBa0042D13.18 protein, related, partial [Eimeria necatrix]